MTVNFKRRIRRSGKGLADHYRQIYQQQPDNDKQQLDPQGFAHQTFRTHIQDGQTIACMHPVSVLSDEMDLRMLMELGYRLQMSRIHGCRFPAIDEMDMQTGTLGAEHRQG